MNNVFIELIKNGKINNLDELKKAFRKIAKKTHPDAIGTDKFVSQFLMFKNHYESAKKFLLSENIVTNYNVITDKNYRYLFFLELQKLDALELPHNKNIENFEKIFNSVNKAASLYFKKWKADQYDLYLSANCEYGIIKNEKYENSLANLRKPSLYKNLQPIFFNIAKYHITGLIFYKKQLERNIDSINRRLEENKFLNLKEYILLLIKDMSGGPAVFG